MCWHVYLRILKWFKRKSAKSWNYLANSTGVYECLNILKDTICNWNGLTKVLSLSVRINGKAADTTR